MSLRPVPARWFELLTTREDLVRALEILAHTGKIQLETRSRSTRQAIMPDLRDRFEEFNRLARRYRQYWPAADLASTGIPERPDITLARALEGLRAWQLPADPILAQLESCGSEHADLQRLQQMLLAASLETLDFSLLTRPGPNILARIYILPLGGHLTQLPPVMRKLSSAGGSWVR